MTVTIRASNLARLLTDLLDTEAGTGIRLDSARAAIGENPGAVDLLTGFSSTGFVIGHTWTDCSGDNPASVWPNASAGIVVAICKTLTAKDEMATVDITMTTAPPPENPVDGEHPGWTVLVRQTPALFNSDTEFEFHAAHASALPEETLWRIFTEAPENADPLHVDSAQTAWSTSVLAPLLRIAKRRSTSKHNEAVRLFRASDRSTHLAQIGTDWLGAVQPRKLVPPDTSEHPTIAPLLPVKVLDA